MRCAIYDTEEEALDAIEAIDLARGTETVRLPSGETVERPVRTWAVPIPLKSGKWAVKLNERVRRLGGRTRRITTAHGTRVLPRDVAIPRQRDAVDVRDEDRDEELEDQRLREARRRVRGAKVESPKRGRR